MAHQLNTKPQIKMKKKVYKGIIMMENEIEEIENMETRPDDIWVCSFPRSGTTLTQEMVYLIQTLDFDRASLCQLDERFPIIDFKDERYPYYKGIKTIKDMMSPRMIKSHFHYFLLPEQLRNGKGRFNRLEDRNSSHYYQFKDSFYFKIRFFQIIYVARNPKDVLLSFYKLGVYGSELVDGNKTFDQFVDSFIRGTEYACPWTRHVLEYWERRNDGHVLFLKFEDIIRDKAAAVSRIASFLSRDLTKEDVVRIAEHCHVDKMRNNPMVNGSYWNDFKQMNHVFEGRFINKGESGTWKEELTLEQSQKIDNLILDIEKFGLYFYP